MDWGDGEAAATKVEEEEEEQGGASAPAGAGRAFGSIADDDGSRRESWLGPDGDTDLAGGASAAYFVDDKLVRLVGKQLSVHPTTHSFAAAARQALLQVQAQLIWSVG